MSMAFNELHPCTDSMCGVGVWHIYAFLTLMHNALKESDISIWIKMWEIMSALFKVHGYLRLEDSEG